MSGARSIITKRREKGRSRDGDADRGVEAIRGWSVRRVFFREWGAERKFECEAFSMCYLRGTPAIFFTRNTFYMKLLQGVFYPVFRPVTTNIISSPKGFPDVS
jgi:hypothetical protein